MNKKVIPKSRILLYWFIAVFIIPCVVIGGIELGLRAFNYGYHTDFTVRSTKMGRDVFRENESFNWPYFSPALARTTRPFTIPAGKKPPGTYRIFVLGGSAAAGYPVHYLSFARILEQMFRDKFPQVTFEVINSATVAINSHVVLEIAKDLSRFEGDLFIVYMGNNEVVGPYGAGTVLVPFQKHQSLIRLAIFLNSTRLGQLVRNLASYINLGRHEFPEEWKGMELFVNNQVKADDARMKYVYKFFQNNLEDIIDVSRSNGAKVVVSSVVTNLKDLAPFGSLHGEDVNDDWKVFFREGVRYQEDGGYAGAIENYERAEKIDPYHADLHFRLGRCYYAIGKYDDAKREFIKARDLDTLRFRADTTINNIIKKVAQDNADEGVYFVDAVKVFEENSPGKIPGREFLYEHVHLSFNGNYLLAREIFERVKPELPEWVREKEVTERQVLSLNDAKIRLAYTGYNRYVIAHEVRKIIGLPPFTQISNHQELVDESSERMEKLKVHKYRGELRKAARQHLEALKSNPDDKWIHFNLGVIYLYLKEFEKAADSFKVAVREMPEYKPAEGLLKNALGEKGFP